MSKLGGSTTNLSELDHPVPDAPSRSQEKRFRQEERPTAPEYVPPFGAKAVPVKSPSVQSVTSRTTEHPPRRHPSASSYQEGRPVSRATLSTARRPSPTEQQLEPHPFNTTVGQTESRTSSRRHPSDQSIQRSQETPKPIKRPSTGHEAVMGLLTPENSAEDIAELARPANKVNPLSNQAFVPSLPLTPPQSPPESPERVKIRRVPLPRVETELREQEAAAKARAAQQVPAVPASPISPAKEAPEEIPPKAPLARKSYSRSASRDVETHPSLRVVPPENEDKPAALPVSDTPAPIPQLAVVAVVEAAKDAEPAEALKALISSLRGKMGKCTSVQDCLQLLDEVWKEPVATPEVTEAESGQDHLEARMVEYFLSGMDRPFDEEGVPSLDSEVTSADESESEVSTTDFQPEEPLQVKQSGYLGKERGDSFSTADEEQEAIAL
jgi:hypothetical protein